MSVEGADGKLYEIEQRSLGFKWYFSFLFFILSKKSDNALFLIDEPASNLYSIAQEGILESLEKLSKENQVIYTTHSPYLLNDNSIVNGFLAKNSNIKKQNVESGIKIISLKNIDINSKEWAEYTKTLQDYNTLRMPKCYLCENNLFIEGFEDWIILSVFCRAMLDKLKNISLIYCNGSSSMSNEIRYAIYCRKNFLVILDNDEGGENAIKKYEKEFQCFSVGKYIKKLNELIIGNNNNIKDIQTLIDKNDKEKICALCDVEYNKKNKILIINCCKGIYNKYYLDKDNKIIKQLNSKLSSQTKENFTKLANAIEGYFNNNNKQIIQ